MQRNYIVLATVRPRKISLGPPSLTIKTRPWTTSSFFLPSFLSPLYTVISAPPSPSRLNRRRPAGDRPSVLSLQNLCHPQGFSLSSLRALCCGLCLIRRRWGHRRSGPFVAQVRLIFFIAMSGLPTLDFLLGSVSISLIFPVDLCFQLIISVILSFLFPLTTILTQCC